VGREVNERERPTVFGKFDSVAQRVRQHLTNPQPISEYQPIVERLDVLHKSKSLALGSDLEDPSVVDDVGDGERSLFEDEFASLDFADVL
jgi:hypothetical protein